MFEPFFTTKSPGKGTGLGLSTIKRIVESFEGSIFAVSISGQETRFIVELLSTNPPLKPTIPS